MNQTADLHSHTLYSDGVCSIEEVLTLAQQAQLTVFSITDHNHCFAYEHLPAVSPFTGTLLCGTEIATSYKGRIIELLGYGVDSKLINKWYRSAFNIEQLTQKEHELFDRLISICQKLGYRLTDNLVMPEIRKGISKKIIYQDLISYSENRSKSEGLLDSYKKFLRFGLSNPNSGFYLNEATTYPSLSEVLRLIHEAGGLAFLAHPYEYGIDNVSLFLEELNTDYHLDGIETYYPSFTAEQIALLEQFAAKHQLLVSGGSDFHGTANRKAKIGQCANGLPIPLESMSEWIDRYIELV